MKIYWKVKATGCYCIFEHLQSAWEDYNSHDDDRLIYPVIMSEKKFNSLPEFNGW
jgi:hypothetical protein